SAGIALSLLMEASDGETRSQIMEFLAAGGSIDEVRSIYTSLIANVSQKSRNVIVQVASSVFVDKRIRLSKDYADSVKRIYAATTRVIDYTRGAASAKV
ncbi:hypothetical protein PENTCL1PPCAC_26224, partial [Pristionchus entomophagus]